MDRLSALLDGRLWWRIAKVKIVVRTKCYCEIWLLPLSEERVEYDQVLSNAAE